MGWFRRKFFTGLIILLPTVVTIYIFYRVFVSMDNVLKPLVLRYPFLDIPGLGVLSVVLIVLLTGIFAGNLFGRTIISWLETVVFRIPLFSRMYIAIKQLSEVFLKQERTVFKRTVLVQYPRPGIYVVAFVTSTWRFKDESGEARSFVNVFLPTTPNPTSGLFLMIPEEEAIPFDYTIEEALKLVISGGAVLPGTDSTENGFPVPPGTPGSKHLRNQ
ncbi:MAG TPA: DUF502 domain-containing protein [Candidatus Eisenbacteria bacterium]|uniref:DUF502 domain-containing protein n=1 Tax=Eiseniibacteriota bacterium TaxID=2212470 RepID=A0A7V2F400_UNCEI|nr:DUF502 domain-containing protein [Candidatus Eisenbacteria bacterium]